MSVTLAPPAARAAGIALGVLADRVFADPRRYHPVAGFGRAAMSLERALHRDRRSAGVAYTALGVGLPVALGLACERVGRARPPLGVLLTAAATWAVLGGASLAREGEVMAGLLERADLAGARDRLSHLCARDPAAMGPDDLARASVESLAENVSDAVVAPLCWGVVAGVPGLLGYRAANTLDAMVGYRSARYARFGWASARLDDVLNLVPARLAGGLIAVCAPAVGGSTGSAWAVLRRDGGAHPSPNAGRPEAAAAGALGVALGGANTYHGAVERRPVLGAGGRAPAVGDVRRATRLITAVGALAGALAVAGAAAGMARGNRARRIGRAA